MDFINNLLKRFGFLDKDSFARAALPDNRSDEERSKDYSFFEVVAGAAPVNWKEKKRPTKDTFDLNDKTWRRFPEQFQLYTSSCVAQTGRKLMGILSYLQGNGYVDYSANHIYRRRSNRPGEGMAAIDAFSIMKAGVALEENCESDNFTSDAAMEAAPLNQTDNFVSIAGYVALPIGDIDILASTIQATNKGLMFWMWGDKDEWEYRLTVKRVVDIMKAYFRHSVAVVDYTLDDGKKCLVIDESAYNQTARNGQRLANEEFVKTRNYYAAYPISLLYKEKPIPTPKGYQFMKTLVFIPLDKKGYISDTALNAAQFEDVKRLQDFLRKTGDFPANIPSTGYYGALTAKAVLAWQIRNEVDNLANLKALAGKSFGPKSRAKANQ